MIIPFLKKAFRLISHLVLSLAIAAGVFFGSLRVGDRFFNTEATLPPVIQFGDYSINMLADRIENLREGEVFVIHINCLGGNVFQGLPLLNALKNTKGHVVADIDGYAASLAALVALSSAEINAEENSIIMIHVVRDGTGTIIHDPHAEILNQFAKKIVEPYLTDREENFIFTADQDFWISGKDMQARFEKVHPNKNPFAPG